jgi:hypothetical protein
MKYARRSLSKLKLKRNNSQVDPVKRLFIAEFAEKA